MDHKYCLYCMRESDTDVCPHCKKDRKNYVSAPHHLAPGTLLSDRYLIGRVLGEGGFGITYIGRDTFLDLRVAIKEFFPSGIVNRNSTVSAEIATGVTSGGVDLFEKGKDRFLSEARTLAKFSTEEHVVTVRDFFPANNTAYIVMDFLEGIDLTKFIGTNGPQSFPRTVELLMPIIEVLEKVHKTGLIHRDISPSNIMILGTGKIILLDFGAARDYSSAEKSLSIMLKPGYAPQEQYGSKCQGPWTDVYALSATMYKMLTDVTPEDSMSRTLSDELKPVEALNKTVTHFQSAVIMRGMSLNYKDRYQSMTKFKEALKASLATVQAPIKAPMQAPMPASAQTVQAPANMNVPHKVPQPAKPVQPSRPAVQQPQPQPQPQYRPQTPQPQPQYRPQMQPQMQRPNPGQYYRPPVANQPYNKGVGGKIVFQIFFRFFAIFSFLVMFVTMIDCYSFEDLEYGLVASIVLLAVSSVFALLTLSTHAYKTKRSFVIRLLIYSGIALLLINVYAILLATY